MPDFERVTRSLELHLAAKESPEKVAFVRGVHAGLSRARKQVALTAAVLAVVVVVLAAYWPLS